jgi:signal transduction histidine kinase
MAAGAFGHSVRPMYSACGGDYDRSVRFGGRVGRVVLDLGICVVLIGYTLPATLDPEVNGRVTALGTALLPAVVLPILWRRRAPFAAACAFSVGCVISGIPTFDQFRLASAVPSALLILFALASRAERARALGGLALVLAGIAFIGATDVVIARSAQDGTGDGIVGYFIFTFPLCGGIWATGRIVWSRKRVAERLAERSRQLDLQREQTAALAVEVERTRLASDLDTAARARLREMIELAESGGEVERELFARIERLGRESLNEMRGLLGVLRSDERGERSPRPTLAQIDTLLAEARAGGSWVDLEIVGERSSLGAGVELAAYRTVQHALVAVNGTDRQPATVQLRYLSGALELEVRGFPPDGSAAAAALMAARERVMAHGGTFSTDSPARGQRVLRARLAVAATDG